MFSYKSHPKCSKLEGEGQVQPGTSVPCANFSCLTCRFALFHFFFGLCFKMTTFCGGPGRKLRSVCSLPLPAFIQKFSSN